MFTLYHVEYGAGNPFEDYSGIHYRNQRKIWIKSEASISFKKCQYIVSNVRVELNTQQATGVVISFLGGEILPDPILHAIFKVVLI